MESFKSLLLANKAWREQIEYSNPNFMENLKEDQAPEHLWIGCSDSRVPVEMITGSRPNEIYVHRNLANLIKPDDLNVMSVIEFAVSVLKVKNIIVCGHYGCGGVRSALAKPDERLHALNAWVDEIRQLRANHSDRLQTDLKDVELVDRVAELNVVEQVRQLTKLPQIQSAWKDSRRPLVHGWIFNLRTGLLEQLVKADPARRNGEPEVLR